MGDAEKRDHALERLGALAGAGHVEAEVAWTRGRSVELLLLGGHRSEPMDGLLGGSIAERLADQAPCALLALPPDARTRITRTA